MISRPLLVLLSCLVLAACAHRQAVPVDLLIDNVQRIGAVGVSGVKSSEDAQIARAGIAALGV